MGYILAGIALIVGLLIAVMYVDIHNQYTAPCQTFHNDSVKNIPARCVQYYK